MLGTAARPAEQELLEIVHFDPVDQVRIAAAEALVWAGSPDEAVTLLATLADEPHPPEIRLQAFNALTYIGKAALPALPVIRRATSGGDRLNELGHAADYLEAVLTGTYHPRNDAIASETCLTSLRSGRLFMGPPPSADWPR